MTSAVLRRWLSARTTNGSGAALSVLIGLCALALALAIVFPRSPFALLAAALAGASLLHAPLLSAVRRAARRIEDRDRELEERGRELRSVNDALRAARAQLAGAERTAVGEMAAALAHGIRNPLANIRASAQVALLDCGQCGASALPPKNLSAIVREVDRLDSVLKELLQFARPSERHCQPVDLNALLRDARDFMGRRLAEAGVEIEDRLAPVLPVILGDPILLEHVFATFVENAIEAIPAGGGRITLTTGTTDEGGRRLRVFAEVQDDGAGIGPDRMGRIFDPFYSTKAQGTGLGLSVAKKIAEAHGGIITVRSRPGEGAAFRVALPARRAD